MFTALQLAPPVVDLKTPPPPPMLLVPAKRVWSVAQAGEMARELTPRLVSPLSTVLQLVPPVVDLDDTTAHSREESVVGGVGG